VGHMKASSSEKRNEGDPVKIKLGIIMVLI
jgi:hypothetical protein